MSPRARWTGILAAVAAYDVYCARNATPGDSLSEVLRELYRVSTPAGRATFVVSVAALATWFVPHICRQAAAAT